jgi:hypothetical protein
VIKVTGVPKRDKTGVPPLCLIRTERRTGCNGLGPDDRERWTRDPRASDLPEVRVLWEFLLQASYDYDAGSDRGLFGSLHGMRCLGARLERALWGVRLVPGENGRGQFAGLRQRYLLPWAVVLEALLGELADAHGEAGGLTVRQIRTQLRRSASFVRAVNMGDDKCVKEEHRCTDGPR